MFNFVNSKRRHIKKFFLIGRTTKSGEGKTPLTTKKKNFFFYDFKKKYQNLMKHKKN